MERRNPRGGVSGEGKGQHSAEGRDLVGAETHEKRGGAWGRGKGPDLGK